MQRWENYDPPEYFMRPVATSVKTAVDIKNLLFKSESVSVRIV